MSVCNCSHTPKPVSTGTCYAGKTTLTEKLLLYGGAVQEAGAVRTRADQRSATSDFMELEKQRGISISSTVRREWTGPAIRRWRAWSILTFDVIVLIFFFWLGVEFRLFGPSHQLARHARPPRFQRRHLPYPRGLRQRGRCMIRVIFYIDDIISTYPLGISHIDLALANIFLKKKHSYCRHARCRLLIDRSLPLFLPLLACTLCDNQRYV